MEANTVQCLSKQQCTGCSACANYCPTNCITMQGDEEGFLYPVINESKCIRCGNCKNSCPIITPPMKPETGQPPDCYAAWSKDHEIRFQSSSGGLFTHLAQAILARGGVVAGAVYCPNHLVKHTLVSDMNGLDALRQSKYVQSETGFIYKSIEEKLQKNVPVLFAGTPCQCAGLLSFLRSKPQNLILCDFICHGVNSPLVHQQYIGEVERELGCKVMKINHRDKHSGWKAYQVSVEGANQNHLLGGKLVNPFLRGFLTDLYLRPSCYACRFKGTVRPTDLTLADCWGYPHEEPLGVSLVLVHSQTGASLLQCIKCNIYLEEYPLQDAIKKNPSICASAADRFQKRNTFFAVLNQCGNLRDAIINLLSELE